jgi:alkanesulfonate monooxygenase SsuD/methylene tetrahydromethanopterin reductase-like flavin-dependent oxidoreductase (luciferase family)
LAARTGRLLLGSGIIQIGTRTPVSIAMTALSLARISEGRFLLGLGASGPQVIEGLHGVPFAAPLTRMRETIEVIGQAFAGEKIAYSGVHQVGFISPCAMPTLSSRFCGSKKITSSDRAFPSRTVQCSEINTV